MSDERRQEMAGDALAEVIDECDGPLLSHACCIALTSGKHTVGACIVTEPTDTSDVPDLMRSQPHLTWIFIARLFARSGLGTAMLRHALSRLQANGRHTLFSTFLIGNNASALWHWECDFKLLANPYSMRAISATS